MAESGDTASRIKHAGRAPDESQQKLREKRTFYDSLDYACSDMNLPDVGLQSSVAKLKKANEHHLDERGLKSRHLQRPPGGHVTGPKILRTTTSDIGPLTFDGNTSRRASSSPSRPSTAVPAALPIPTAPAALRYPHTNSALPAMPSISAIPKVTGKRKRENKVTKQPEAQQIFKDLNFYFFPNTDTNSARRMRITKALEFGASWYKDWSDAVTHVIVDEALDYKSVLKFLDIPSVPSSVTVVNEVWPAQCIAYRALVDPYKRSFQVRGAPNRTDATVRVEPREQYTANSDASLKLKPVAKSLLAKPQDTQRSQTPLRETPLVQQPPISSEPMIVQEDGLPNGGIDTTEEMDAVIAQARQLAEIPLDDDEDDFSDRPDSSSGLKPDAKPSSRSHSIKSHTLNDRFQCMTKHTGDALDSANANIIAVLQQMADYYAEAGDEWRPRAYRQAIATLRNHPHKISTKEEALALPKIGDRLATKIEEIAFTSRLRRLDTARAEPGDQALQSFMKIYGVGFVQASKWVSQGYKTLDDLLRNADMTETQRIGLLHYEDFNTRIPRAEVERHGATVRRYLQGLDARFEVIVGGSYRRGAQTSGDIDCIITHSDASIQTISTTVLGRLVPRLTAEGFLTAALASSSREDGTKWHGASCLPGSNIWRRIDLLLVPHDELGAALIYFTGNDIFNRSLRLLASTKGMRLNQRGLYKNVMRGKAREKITEGTLIEGKNEKRIFDILGVPWRPSHHRNP